MTAMGRSQTTTTVKLSTAAAALHPGAVAGIEITDQRSLAYTHNNGSRSDTTQAAGENGNS